MDGSGGEGERTGGLVAGAGSHGGHRPVTGRVPDFFIVGHHKSGTTALYEMLRRHPQIFMPDVKEPRWFGRDLHLQQGPGEGLPRTYEEYLALFAPAGSEQLAGEASPSYLRSSVAAREIAAVQPRARCIAILREPASFVRSLHLQMVKDGVEAETDLRRAVEMERIERDGTTILRYSDHIHYAQQLMRYREVFADDQLLVLLYDDFRSDNEGTVRAVLEFLGVDAGVPLPMLEANPTVRMRSTGLNVTLRRLQRSRAPLARAVRAAIPVGTRRRVVGALRRHVIDARPDPVDEGLEQQLKRRYAPEVRALGEQLDRDVVTLWGYDGLV